MHRTPVSNPLRYFRQHTWAAIQWSATQARRAFTSGETMKIDHIKTSDGLAIMCVWFA